MLLVYITIIAVCIPSTSPTKHTNEPTASHWRRCRPARCTDSSKQGTEQHQQHYLLTTRLTPAQTPRTNWNLTKQNTEQNVAEKQSARTAAPTEPNVSSAPNHHWQVHTYVQRTTSDRQTDRWTTAVCSLFTLLLSSRWLAVLRVFGIFILLLLILSNIEFLVNHLWNGFYLSTKFLLYLVQSKPVSTHNPTDSSTPEKIHKAQSCDVLTKHTVVCTVQ